MGTTHSRIIHFAIPINHAPSGRAISGELHLPLQKSKDASGRYPAVVFSHGFYGNRYANQGGMFIPIINALAKKGIACVIFDYSGNGDNAFPYTKTSIKTEAQELDAVVAWAQRNPRINEHKVGVVGHSMGGPVAYLRGPKGITAMAIIASPTDQYGVLKARSVAAGVFNPSGITPVPGASNPANRYPVGPRFWKDAKAFRYRDSLKRFHCPTLFIHGTKDKSVHVQDSKDYLKHANAPKSMVMVSGADHLFTNPGARRDLSRAVSNWFTKYLLPKYREVVNALVIKGDKILLVKRGGHVGDYQHYWSCVAGYLDEGNTPLEQCYTELLEETQITRKDVAYIGSIKPAITHDRRTEKTWKRHALLFEAKTSRVVLDWENTAYAWVTMKQMRRLHVFPWLPEVFEEAIRKAGLGARFGIHRGEP